MAWQCAFFPGSSGSCRRVTPMLFAAFTAWAVVAPPAHAVQAVPIGSFSDPVHVAVAPGSPRLLFVVERSGIVRVMRDEQKLRHPFLDIRDLVHAVPDTGAGNEQGLLSIAFAPDHEITRRFYVFFTNVDGDLEVNEFRRSAEKADQADRSTRRVLLVIPHRDGKNHNGGQLQFGPDGNLFISTGDGGGGGAGEPARHLNNLLGKILRIDPRQDGARPYRIPEGNPYRGRPGRDEIFAYGLRNPWRFAFDGARLAIGDVGENRREEINFLRLRDTKGANFGWPEYEGELVFDPDRPGPNEPIFPIFTYSHPADNCAAVIGGYVVRDPNLPALAGRYLYGDACTGNVRSFIARVKAQEATDNAPTEIVLPGLTSFGQGFNGRLYMTQRGSPAGAVYRLAP